MLISAIKTVCINKAKGFTLIELIIVVSIIGILAALAVPTFSTIIANASTRTVAESIQNGLKLAQTEAVQRGRKVEFILTNDTPALAATASTTGKNWATRTIQLGSASTAEAFIQGANLVGTGSSVVATAGSAIVRFNSLGRLDSPAAEVAYNLTNAKGDRPLRVVLNVGGGLRLCDPDPSKPRATNADGCT